ncbi:MAG: hypothetical protein RL660_1477 [Bacteroidota bacterium]|jgi:uncharacterized OsmC-like protein
MATTAEIVYVGSLRTIATHVYSGTSITTDAPLDNHGLAQSFSPTDLVASALASCMLSIMGIASRTHELDINGTSATVEKIMAAEPRRISGINIVMTMPANNFSDKSKQLLENAARTCPVWYSLHSDIEKNVSFVWL